MVSHPEHSAECYLLPRGRLVTQPLKKKKKKVFISSGSASIPWNLECKRKVWSVSCQAAKGVFSCLSGCWWINGHYLCLKDFVRILQHWTLLKAHQGLLESSTSTIILLGWETTHICCQRNCRMHLIFWHHQEGWKFWSTAWGAKLCFPGRCHTWGTQFNAPVCPETSQFLALYKMKMVIITYPTHSDCCNRVAETQKSCPPAFISSGSKMEEKNTIFFFFSVRMRAVPIPTSPSLYQDGVKNDGHILVLSICSVIRGIWMPKHYFNLQMRG